MQTDVNTLNTERQKECINLKTKTEQFTKTHTKMKKALQEFEEQKKSTEKVDMTDVSALKESQDFINAEFEKLKLSNNNIEKRFNDENGDLQSQIREVAQVVEHNVKKTTNNAQYTREELLTIVGIPENDQIVSANADSDNATNNNCEESKKAVIDLCKELNLIVDPNKISIAHRLKKSRFSKGPRPIIVKFSSKEVCREVYSLRKVCKAIDEWAFNPRAKKIYINESLTPEKRRLLYDTKQAANHKLYDIHGVIYVWTHRGDVYMRKNAQGAPKVKVDSQLELRNIVEGHTSLDKEKESGSALNLIQWRYVKNPWSLKHITEIAAP